MIASTHQPAADARVGDAWGRLAFQVLNYDEGIAQARMADVDSMIAFVRDLSKAHSADLIRVTVGPIFRSSGRVRP